MLGLVRHEYEDINKVFDHGVQQGIGYHAQVRELAPDSEIVDLTVKLRNTFLNRFAQVRKKFPGVDGEALFVSTVIHSLDHQCLVWNIPDPLWLEMASVREDFVPMAELGRFVLVGFTPALPLLLVRTRYSQASHPFFRAVYNKAVQFNKRFADKMDTCIVR